MPELRKDFPVAAIDNPARAAQAKERVGLLRNQIEQEYARRKSACYSHFFATSCVDRVGVTYRSAKSDLQRIESEAEAFEHRYAAEQKEQQIAQRRLEEAAKQSQRDARIKQQTAKGSARADAQKKKTMQQQQRTAEIKKRQTDKQIKQDKKRKEKQPQAEEMRDKQRKYQEKRKKIEEKIAERDQRVVGKTKDAK